MKMNIAGRRTRQKHVRRRQRNSYRYGYDDGLRYIGPSIPSAAASSSPLGAMKMHMVMDMGMQLEGS